MNFRVRYLMLGVLGTLLLPVGVQAASNIHRENKAIVSPVTIKNNAVVKKINPIVLEVQRGEIIDQVAGDVDGDGKDEEVLLMGSKIIANSNFMGNIYVIVKDIKDGKIKSYIRPKTCGGYNSFLTLNDVTGNGLANVIITAPTGGSGGTVDLRVLDFTNGVAKEIFTIENNSGIAFVGQYLRNYKAKLMFPVINKTIVVDLANKQELYRNLNVYNENGDVKKSGAEPYMQGFCSALAFDADNDGVAELLTTQKIVGPTPLETIGQVRTVWKYMAGLWQAKQTNIYLALQSKNRYGKQTDIIGAGGYFIKKQELEINGNRITYPHFSKMGIGYQQGKANGQVDAFVRKVLSTAGNSGQTEMHYEVKFAGKNYLSLLFTGVQTTNHKSRNIMQAFNFNMQTGESVSLEDLVGNSAKFWGMIKEECNKKELLVTKADVQGFYYDGDSLVLLYKDKEVFAITKGSLIKYLRKNKSNKVFD
ncbi:MAG: hypothetical protein PHR07_06240 [Acidaminococcaceae bacterium]|nr:hypothetical protein [Acidaminococcaceae bacterium]